jgi:hypothetical protein
MIQTVDADAALAVILWAKMGARDKEEKERGSEAAGRR